VVSDDDGLFTFVDLTPDQYQIRVIPPDGFETLTSDLVTLPLLDPGGSLTQELNVAIRTNVPTDPKAIDLVSFTATPKEGSILLRWETAAEERTSGFHLHMGANSSFATATRLTTFMVLSQGSQGGIYELEIPYDPIYDPPLHELRFWLVEVEISNAENSYGPIGILQPALYLPLVRR
jgi:hypothetical protein